MILNKSHLNEWAQKLESGDRADNLLEIAGRLEKSRFEFQTAMTLEFRRQLRRDLLNKHEATAGKRTGDIMRLTYSAFGLGLIAVITLVTWLSIGRGGVTAPGGMPLTPAAVNFSGTATPFPIPRYILGAYAVNPKESIPPGTVLEISLLWELPEDAEGDRWAFVHLLDSEDQLLAQSDGLVIPAPAETLLRLELPEVIRPGEYELIAGLYDRQTGARYPLVLHGETRFFDSLGEINIEPRDNGSATNDSDQLVIRSVVPENGAVLTGSEELNFQIQLDYVLSTQPEALLDVRIAALEGSTGGRGVGRQSTLIHEGQGTIELEVLVNPVQEFAGPAYLGIWLQLKTDETSPPFLVEMPEANNWRWRYEP
jgi:hypothetical protein